MGSLTVNTEATSLYDLKFWSGAKDNIEAVKEAGLESELFEHLCEVFDGGATDTEINDYVWFGTKTWGNAIGLFEPEDVIRALIDYGYPTIVISTLESFLNLDDVDNAWCDLIDNVVANADKEDVWDNLPNNDEVEQGNVGEILAELKRMNKEDGYEVLEAADDDTLNSEMNQFIKTVINSANSDEIKNVVEDLSLDLD